MNHWAFITAAYGLTLAATLLMLLASWRQMRKAETAAANLRNER